MKNIILSVFFLLAGFNSASAGDWLITPGHVQRFDESPQVAGEPGESIYFSGRRCGVVAPPEWKQVEIEKSLGQFLMSKDLKALRQSSIEVPVYLHVIQSTSGRGKISARDIKAQIEVLNKAYKPYDISFVLVGTQEVVNDNWATLDRSRALDMKRKLGKKQGEYLNLYVSNLADGLLGFATFPWNLEEEKSTDGVVISAGSFVGGSFEKYNLGDTVVHEVGHWLGLYHTFQGGCGGDGDQVADTPAEQKPGMSCSRDHNRDSCPEPGKDPITNYMDYTEDFCMDHFSSGQAARMKQMVAKFRPTLVRKSGSSSQSPQNVQGMTGQELEHQLQNILTR